MNMNSTPIPQEQIDFCRAVAKLAVEHGCTEFTLTYNASKFYAPDGHDDWSDQIVCGWNGQRHNENKQMHITSTRRHYVNINAAGKATFGAY